MTSTPAPRQNSSSGTPDASSRASASVAPVAPVAVGPHRCGDGSLMLIAGPCVLQSESLTLQIANSLLATSQKHGVQLVFKASFDKANRTSLAAVRGPGIEEGLAMLAKVKAETGLPTTTDIHLPDQAAAAAEVCDLLQIPAFLARQTDLLVAAAETGKPINVKKGQFMSPDDMKYAVEKIRGTESVHGNAIADRILLCERGTFFGYGRLVNDMTSLPTMRSLGVPVVFDATHSVQRPGGLGGATGGNREMVEPLARAAVAMGVDALFFETHPDPSKSPSDGPNMIPLDQFDSLIGRLIKLHQTVMSLGS